MLPHHVMYVPEVSSSSISITARQQLLESKRCLHGVGVRDDMFIHVDHGDDAFVDAIQSMRDGVAEVMKLAENLRAARSPWIHLAPRLGGDRVFLEVPVYSASTLGNDAQQKLLRDGGGQYVFGEEGNMFIEVDKARENASAGWQQLLGRIKSEFPEAIWVQVSELCSTEDNQQLERKNTAIRHTLQDSARQIR